MNNLPLQPLVWETPLSGYIAFALSATNSYKIYADNTKYKLEYRLFGNAIRDETGFATIDEAKAWAWNHYNEKMQPYVKPMPTWIDVSERLPSVDTDTQFICAYDSAIDTFSKVVWFNADIGEFNYQHDDVLAWMPIPEFSTMQNLHNTIEAQDD